MGESVGERVKGSMDGIAGGVRSDKKRRRRSGNRIVDKTKKHNFCLHVTKIQSPNQVDIRDS